MEIESIMGKDIEVDFGVIDENGNINGLIGLDVLLELGVSIDLKNLNRFEHFLKTYSFNFTKDFKDCKAILHIKLNEKEEQEFEIFCKNFAPFEIEKL